MADKAGPAPQIIEPDPTGACFTVLGHDLGLCQLRRRSPTLDGTVPLRVAQGCVPFLQGNAFGWQVHLQVPLRLIRRLSGWALHLQPREREHLRHLHALALVQAVRQRQLGPAWQQALGQGFLHAPRLLSSRLMLWTGLLLRPDPGVWLHVLPAANRRHTCFTVDQATLPDDCGFLPLYLHLEIGGTDLDELVLEGEIACLAPLRPQVRFARPDLDQAPELLRAHAAFYDAGYFARKKRGLARRYRQRINHDPTPLQEGPARCEVVAAGEGGPGGAQPPMACEVARLDRFVSAAGPVPGPRPAEQRALEHLIFRNQHPFTARFDGYSLVLGHDPGPLREAGAALRQVWERVVGAEFVRQHQGALWYLTKYFTPHQPGEPHFFVKPWAFIRTPPGWSSLLEGCSGPGYDVLRGVVATDQFHAAPAVFALRSSSITVQRGTPLLKVFPLPRALLGAGFRTGVGAGPGPAADEAAEEAP